MKKNLIFSTIFIFLLIFSFPVVVNAVGSGNVTSVNGYTCPSEYTLSGTACIKSEKAYQRNGAYYCDPKTQAGAKLEGTNCVWMIEATKVDEGSNESESNSNLTCSEGYTLVGSTCTKVAGSVKYRDGVYYCDIPNTTQIGTSCVYLYEAEEKQYCHYCSSDKLYKWSFYNDSLVECDIVSDVNSKEECLEKNDNITNGDSLYGCEVIPLEIRNWIKDALNLVKYIALVLVIVLGIVDFIKAATSGEADQMKKSGQSFLKRIIAVVILFLLPVLVELILNLIEIYGADSTCLPN